MIKNTDFVWLLRALALAENGLLSTAPNPRVGCVIRRGQKTIGEGWHRRAGEPHAEICAMQQSGDNLQDAEVYVSLEPCAHIGKTDSCAAALVAAKPARVIVAMPDPNPQVAGKGLSMLRAAGIETVCASPTDEVFLRAMDLNIGFVSRMIRRRPWVRLKIAATADGKTALSSGLSRWISNAESRADAHQLRARSGALITGIGTALIDNPRLTVRHAPFFKQPLRILIDRDLRASADMRLFVGGGAMVATAAAVRHVADGVEVLSLPDRHGRVDLAALLQALAIRGMNEITVEAGRRLCGAFIAANLVDEIVVYQAPIIFGGGYDMLDFPSPLSPEQAIRFSLKKCTPINGDIKIVYESPSARLELLNATAATIA